MESNSRRGGGTVPFTFAAWNHSRQPWQPITFISLWRQGPQRMRRPLCFGIGSSERFDKSAIDPQGGHLPVANTSFSALYSTRPVAEFGPSGLPIN
jgi:hypothetical protein